MSVYHEDPTENTHPDPATRRVVDELMAVAHALRDTDGAYDFPTDRAAQLDVDYAMSWFPGRGGVPCDD